MRSSRIGRRPARRFVESAQVRLKSFAAFAKFFSFLPSFWSQNFKAQSDFQKSLKIDFNEVQCARRVPDYRDLRPMLGNRGGSEAGRVKTGKSFGGRVKASAAPWLFVHPKWFEQYWYLEFIDMPGALAALGSCWGRRQRWCCGAEGIRAEVFRGQDPDFPYGSYCHTSTY